MRRMAYSLVALLLVGLSTGSTASAGATPIPCTSADTELVFRQARRGFDLLSQGITNEPIVDLVQRCQYRLYFDGAEVTFHENDVFLGGIIFYWTQTELDELGWKRRQAVEDLNLGSDRVWLARKLSDGSIGPLVEQTIRSTPVTNYNHSQAGQTVYRQVAFTAHLPAGDYVSILQDSYPGLPDFNATVTLHIVPA
jgi:hypothetical protein